MQERADMQAETRIALDEAMHGSRGWVAQEDGWRLGNLGNDAYMECRVDGEDIVMAYQDASGEVVEGRGCDLAEAQEVFGAAMANKFNQAPVVQAEHEASAPAMR